VPDNAVFGSVLRDYFPATLRDRFANWIPGHRLAREIVATVLANELINRMGPGFVLRMEERFGAGSPQVAMALAAVRAVLDADVLWRTVSALPDLSVDAQRRLLRRVQDHVEQAASWFVRRRGLALDPTAEQELLHSSIAPARRHLAARADPAEVESLRSERVPADLAEEVASLKTLAQMLDAVDVAVRLRLPVTEVVDAALAVDRELELDFLRTGLADVPGALHWESMATAALRDDLSLARREILEHALTDGAQTAVATDRVGSWLERRAVPLDRLRTTIAELKSHHRLDIAMLCTVVSELRLLAQSRPAHPASTGRTGR
jgi:glutamate dehydrogenase